MRIGLIARADNTGLGTQTWEAFRHLKPAKTLVIDYMPICGWSHNKALHPERYPGATITQGNPTAAEYAIWLRDLDAVFTCETSYGSYLYTLARQMGVRTVLQPNYEMCEHMQRPDVPRPDLFALPTTWHQSDFPEPKKLLPVPIATDRFAPNSSERATRFLHIVGKPAIHDRNGTESALAAWLHVKSGATLTIKSQDPNYPIYVPPGVVIDRGHTDNYWDNYSGFDVLVMPRRYGGLCLPAQEALGASMPVIMPNISPNEWLPTEWLVPASHSGTFWAHNEINIHTADTHALAALIDRFATDQQFYQNAKAKAADLAKTMSWDNLLPDYLECFTQLG
jgi:hypothetical protein